MGDHLGSLWIFHLEEFVCSSLCTNMNKTFPPQTRVASLAKISFPIYSGVWRGQSVVWVNKLVDPFRRLWTCPAVLQQFHNFIPHMCSGSPWGSIKRSLACVTTKWCLRNQYRHLPKKWNVFIFSPEKEMVFVAENFEVNQGCVYQIPRLSVGNWGALHQVLFCWNQNIMCHSAGQGDSVPHQIWGERSLGASLCSVLIFCSLEFSCISCIAWNSFHP